MREVGRAVQALFGPAGCAEPYPHYEALRRAAPVCPLPDNIVLVSRYAEAERVIRDPRFLMEDAAWIGQSHPGWTEHPSFRSLMLEMVNHNPPDHARLRRLVSRAFTPRRVAELRPAVEQLIDDLLDQMAAREGGTADFMADFALPLPVTVIGELLGIPPADRIWFAPRVEAFTDAIEESMRGPSLAEADQAVKELWARLGELADERRRNPRNDMVSELVSVSDSGDDRLSHDELLANLVLLYAAGYETTSNLLGNGLAALLERPALKERLRQNPTQASAFVEEMLRFDPPIQIATRYTAQATTLGGLNIDAGTQIIVLIGSANRDPDRFADPDEFDPDRADGGSMVFGVGAHYCLGAALARMEAEIAFPRLLDRFPAITGHAPGVRRRKSLRGFTQLPISLS
ncbi:cytochrome P450 [Salinispora vitiensis]|uniref:cytochrome P450 n=1 Tax=Salinispora vitiensis TaxID=999544 RepID=UPI000371AB45|nr:cytochrome P450 [Salinispora vitiensis]